MALFIDFIKLEKYISTLDEELREISRTEAILERQRAQYASPLNEQGFLHRISFIKQERLIIQERRAFILKVQEALSRVSKTNRNKLDDVLHSLRNGS